MLFIALGLVVWAAVVLPTALILVEVGFDELDRRSKNVLYRSDSKDSVYTVLHLNILICKDELLNIMLMFGIKENIQFLDKSKWNSDITIDFGQIKFSFKKDSKIEPVMFEWAIKSGNMKDYPFDYYKTQIYFLAEEKK
jgi:hypothetical protein